MERSVVPVAAFKSKHPWHQTLTADNAMPGSLFNPHHFPRQRSQSGLLDPLSALCWQVSQKALFRGVCTVEITPS